MYRYPLFVLTIMDVQFRQLPQTYRLCMVLAWSHPVTTPLFCGLISFDSISTHRGTKARYSAAIPLRDSSSFSKFRDSSSFSKVSASNPSAQPHDYHAEGRIEKPKRRKMQDTGFTNENFSFSNHTTPKVNKGPQDKYGGAVYAEELENLCGAADRVEPSFPNDYDLGQGFVPKGSYDLSQGYGVPKRELEFGCEEDDPSYNPGNYAKSNPENNSSKQVQCDCQRVDLQDQDYPSQIQTPAPAMVAPPCLTHGVVTSTCCIHSPSRRHLCREQLSQETLIM